MSHIESGWEELVAKLKLNPRIDGEPDHRVEVRHPDDLRVITADAHKNDNAKAVWLAVSLFDHTFTYLDICSLYPFLFFEGDFGSSAIKIHERHGYKLEGAKTYLKMRLDRMHRIKRICPRSLWLKTTDLASTDLQPMLEPIL